MAKKSTQFVVKELKIVTKGGIDIDIKNIFVEINIFDTILFPVMSGKLLINDSLG